jgi:aryl-alcohol dehydrogenase-like predicted oxidoreductase
MAELVAVGKVRWIGLSNVGRKDVERCIPVHPVASVQNELSLTVRSDTEELLPWLAKSGIAYLAYSPLASGLLTGSMPAGTTFSEDDWRGGHGKYASWRSDSEPWPFDPDPLADTAARVQAMRPIAERFGLTVAQLALRWVLEQPGVTAAIAGSRSAAHTLANAAAGTNPLDRATVTELSTVFA